MSDDKPLAPRNWLPHLTGSSRSPLNARSQEQPTVPTSVVIEPAFVPGDSTAMAGSSRSRDHLLSQVWTSELESQFGLTTLEPVDAAPEAAVESPGAVITVPGADTTPSGESVDDLKERLAYYEHFDALIRDNVSRSAELFQAVFAERQRNRAAQAENETSLAQVAAEAERRIATEHAHVTNILLSLMDEATYLHQRSDALIQRLAEALTEITPQSEEDDEPVSGA